MNKENQELDTSEDNADQEKRRRLLKSIVATTPVILSVTSRPVLAVRNCSESGQLSGNVSGDPEPCEDEGCSGTFWRNNEGQWHPDYPPRRKFSDVFGVNDFGEARLRRVIRKKEDPTTNCASGDIADVKKLGRQAVAALQNAATRVAYPMLVSEVIATVQNALNDLGSGVDCDNVKLVADTLQSLNNDALNGCPL